MSADPPRHRLEGFALARTMPREGSRTVLHSTSHNCDATTWDTTCSVGRGRSQRGILPSHRCSAPPPCTHCSALIKFSGHTNTRIAFGKGEPRSAAATAPATFRKDLRDRIGNTNPFGNNIAYERRSTAATVPGGWPMSRQQRNAGSTSSSIWKAR